MIEDNQDYIYLFKKKMMSRQAHRIHFECVDRLGSALKHVEKGPYDLILLDLFLPDSNGLETFRKIHAEAPHIPILILTGFDDEEVAIRAIQEGAQDYLIKGTTNGELLQQMIRFAVERHKILEKWKKSWKDEYFLATHDPLTHLPNRSLFEDMLGQSINEAGRHQQKEKLAIFFLDLDHFRRINDSLGHETGDVILQEVAHRLKTCLREEDTVARLGGDTFAILTRHLHKIEDASRVARRITQLFETPFPIANHLHTISASMGISTYPMDGANRMALIKNADTAMYHCKTLGGKGFHHYHLIQGNERTAL